MKHSRWSRCLEKWRAIAAPLVAVVAVGTITSVAAGTLAGCASVPIEELGPGPYPISLRVATYNVRFDDTAEGRERLYRVVSAVEELDADVVGLQEVMTAEGPEFTNDPRLLPVLADSLPDYGIVAPGGSAALGMTTPILYRTDRLFALEQGIRWFSDTPTKPDSTSFGNTLPRSFVWALFYDRRTGSEFLFINTHLDHASVRANRRSAEMLVRFASEHHEYPAIIAGDLNSLRAGAVHRYLVLSGFTPAPARGATFVMPPLRIDHLLFCDEWDHLRSGVVTRRREEPSDHRPLFAEISLRTSD